MRAIAIMLELAGALVWGLVAVVSAEMSGWVAAALGTVSASLVIGIVAFGLRRRWGFWLLVTTGLALSTSILAGSAVLGSSHADVPLSAVLFYSSISVVPLLATWTAGRRERGGAPKPRIEY